MIKRLYGERINENEEAGYEETITRSKDLFEDRIERHKEFQFGYCTYILIQYIMLGCCCSCLSSFFQARYPSCRRQVTSYKKFLVAQERLHKEQDIQRIIDINRLTKVLHKVLFKTRQRRTVRYFRRHVITENDLPKGSEEEQKGVVDYFTQFKKLYRGFDPENEKWDRRFLYEVTGVRLDENEFRESDTSDDDKEEVEQPEIV